MAFERPITVLMRPSQGTNIHAPIFALVQALPPDVRVVKFSWKTAFFGTWDVLHLHWPESLIRASSVTKTWIKYALFAMLVGRVFFSHRSALWTVHNESPHERGKRMESWLLDLWSKVAARRVYLYPSVTPRDASSRYIPFGDYSHVAGRYTSRAPSPRDPNRVLLFGLLRPYKGIEQLVAAFENLARESPDSRLAIMGRPIDEKYGVEIAQQVSGNGSIEFRGQLLEYVDLVGQIQRSGFVVLPYRRMYNSGAALLALSCGTPILVPSSPTMTDLLSEAGPEWVRLYEGDITSEILGSAINHFLSTSNEREGSSALHGRSWPEVAEQYAVVYRELAK